MRIRNASPCISHRAFKRINRRAARRATPERMAMLRLLAQTNMFETNPDFVFTVTRDFVRSCQNPILVLPDEVPAYPYAVAMECAMLAPKAEVSLFPWKEPKE
jgi:hypothetical protein